MCTEKCVLKYVCLHPLSLGADSGEPPSPPPRPRASFSLPPETSLSRVVGSEEEEEEELTVEQHSSRFLGGDESDEDGGSPPPVNLREDVMLSDQDLVTMPTKELNRYLRKRGVSKKRQKELKEERRTLKNR